MSTSDFLIMLVAVIVIGMSVAMGWWAREFVYTLEHITVHGCDTEGSCGNR